MTIDYNSKLIEIPRPSDANLVRKAFIANALSVQNVSAGNPQTRKILEDLLGPTYGKWDLNRPFKVYQKDGRTITEGVSTCAIVARGIWRRMSVNMPALYKNYTPGTAIAAESAFAKTNKVFQAPVFNSDLRPEKGDYVLIGNGLSTHVLTCIDWRENTLISIDGGQTDKDNKGLQCILKKERPWIKKFNSIYLADRVVIGWIVADMLPYKGSTIIVPEEWEEVGL